jgi:Cupin-like domain
MLRIGATRVERTVLWRAGWRRSFATQRTDVPVVPCGHATGWADALRPYYEAPSRPVKLGRSQPFLATSKWTLEYLKETIGNDYPCDIEWGSDMDHGTPRMTLEFAEYATYLALVHDATEAPDPLLYLAQNDLPPVLMPDVEIPSVCHEATLGAGKLYNTMLWMGPIGTVSRLHCDPMDNFLMQITGKKRVYLIDKAVDTTCLYAGIGTQQSNVSAIRDVAAPDLATYPRFADVPTIWTTELQAGDTLFIPRQWWHAVRSLEYSISVNAWWR